jgi:hypothetical protein
MVRFEIEMRDGSDVLYRKGISLSFLLEFIVGLETNFHLL